MSKFIVGDKVLRIKGAGINDRFDEDDTGTVFKIFGDYIDVTLSTGYVSRNNGAKWLRLAKLEKGEKVVRELKVGDTVRIKSDGLKSNWARNNPGSVDTIIGVTPHHSALLAKEGKNGDGVWQEEIELVVPAVEESELETLVKTANEGVLALGKLMKRDDIESYWIHGGKTFPKTEENELLRTAYSKIADAYFMGAVKLRVKSKPSFKPFKVGSEGWTVEVKDYTLLVGCQHFDIKDAKAALHGFLKNNSHFFKDLHATKTGVRYGQHILSWDDVQKIYDAIEKL